MESGAKTTVESTIRFAATTERERIDQCYTIFSTNFLLGYSFGQVIDQSTSQLDLTTFNHVGTWFVGLMPSQTVVSSHPSWYIVLNLTSLIFLSNYGLIIDPSYPTLHDATHFLLGVFSEFWIYLHLGSYWIPFYGGVYGSFYQTQYSKNHVYQS